jgi:hypothetical protein
MTAVYQRSVLIISRVIMTAVCQRFVLSISRGIMTTVYQRSVLIISRGIMTVCLSKFCVSHFSWYYDSVFVKVLC